MGSIKRDSRLKPCPFCGGQAAVLQIAEDSYSIKCLMCDVTNERLRSKDDKYTESYLTSLEAIEAWNKRSGV